MLDLAVSCLVFMTFDTVEKRLLEVLHRQIAPNPRLADTPEDGTYILVLKLDRPLRASCYYLKLSVSFGFVKRLPR